MTEGKGLEGVLLYDLGARVRNIPEYLTLGQHIVALHRAHLAASEIKNLDFTDVLRFKRINTVDLFCFSNLWAVHAPALKTMG
jgi:hypothetical protein